MKQRVWPLSGLHLVDTLHSGTPKSFPNQSEIVAHFFERQLLLGSNVHLIREQGVCKLMS